MSDLERRRFSWVKSHIMTRVVTEGSTEAIYAYIEDLSMTGFGVVSLKPFMKGVRTTFDFLLPQNGRLTPTASAVHSRMGVDSLYYNGFQIDLLNNRDKELLEKYLVNSPVL
jgi:hypothetical protein